MFINFSDDEHAMVALKEAAARACEGVEHTSQACPKGDHAANGQIENTVRELKRQMRALRLNLEKKLRQYNPNANFTKLDDADPVLFWMPEFAANAIVCYRKGPYGKTSYEREFGRTWKKPPFEYGEKISIREAVERGSGALPQAGGLWECSQGCSQLVCCGGQRWCVGLPGVGRGCVVSHRGRRWGHC